LSLFVLLFMMWVETLFSSIAMPTVQPYEPVGMFSANHLRRVDAVSPACSGPPAEETSASPRYF